MDTVLVEITDDRAYEALQELEKQNVIKLLNKKEENKKSQEKPDSKVPRLFESHGRTVQQLSKTCTGNSQ